MTAADLLRSVGDALIAVAVAPRCAACKAVLEHPLQGPICASCWRAIPMLRSPLCRVCGGMLPSWRTISVDLQVCPACRRRPGFVDAGRAVGTYEGPLRDIVHALRGWPTPLGAAINSAERVFDEHGRCLVPRVAQMLDLIAGEVMSFARPRPPRGGES